MTRVRRPSPALALWVLLAMVAACTGIATAATSPSVVSATVPSSTSLDASGCDTGSSYAATVLADAPVAYWRLGDPGSGVMRDSSATANDGSYDSGVAHGIAGAIGGNTDTSVRRSTVGYVATAPHRAELSLANAVSVEMWLRLDQYSTGYASHPVTKWTGTADANYAFYVFGNYGGASVPDEGLVSLYANAGGTWQSVTPRRKVPLGRWVHVVTTYDSVAGGTVYVDGQLVGSAAAAGSLATNAAQIAMDIGEQSGVDEVAIYPTALSASRVEAHYRAGSAGTATTFGGLPPGTGAITTSDCSIAFGSSNDTSMLRMYQQDLGGVAMTGTPEDGVVGQWPVNGSASDVSGSGNTMSLAGGPTYAAGAPGRGQALAFDGVDDSAGVPYSAAYDLDVFTVDAWFRAPAAGLATRMLVEKQCVGGSERNYGIWLQSGMVTGSATVAGLDVKVATGTTYTDDQWHHAALVADGATLRLYVDGMEQASSAYTGDIANPACDLRVGAQTSQNYFNGQLDEVMVAAAARSASEISSQYRARVDDFLAGVSDWSTASTGHFGACLRSVAGGASTGAGTWVVDADSSCTAANTDPWNAIAATAGSPGAKVASSTTSGTTGATANLRFGMRSAASQPPGDYRARLAVEVVAPNA